MSSSHNAEQQQQPTSFLSLPAELRNEIYFQALVLTDQVIFVSGKHGKALPRELPSTLGLLSANQQISAEASSILFGQNVWYANNLAEACEFLSAISRENVARVRRLEMKSLKWGVGKSRDGEGSFREFAEDMKSQLMAFVESVEGGKGYALRLEAVRVQMGRGVYRAMHELQGWHGVEGGWKIFKDIWMSESGG